MAFLAAPAAEDAGAALTRRAGARRAAARKARAGKGSRRIHSGMSAAEVNEELQRRRRQAAQAKADRANAPEPEPEPEPAKPVAEPLFSADRMTVGHAGGGFVLGVLGWAVVRAFIGNPGQPSGPAGVKRLLLAKFFNKTS